MFSLSVPFAVLVSMFQILSWVSTYFHVNQIVNENLICNKGEIFLLA